MSHRPLSMDSRDTSMSNSSSRPVDTSAESGSASGFSLPLRSTRTSSTPDSPSTINGTLGASNDYLVPTEKKTGGATNHGQDLPEAVVRSIGRNGLPLELETSFTRSPRRLDGYASLPQSDPPLPPLGGGGSIVEHKNSEGRSNGRITNKTYGLSSGVTGAGNSSNMSGSKSTQPLLDASPTMEFEQQAAAASSPPHVAASAPKNNNNNNNNKNSQSVILSSSSSPPLPSSSSSPPSNGFPSPAVAIPPAANVRGGYPSNAAAGADLAPSPGTLFAMGPLPPTPTDQAPALSDESPATPSAALSGGVLPLDVSSLRSQKAPPAAHLISNYPYRAVPASGLGAGKESASGVPYTINASGKERGAKDPSSEISV